MKEQIKNKIKNGLIVSCQALEDEPLYSSFIMSKMALAAVQGGAVGIRANTLIDIKAIKQEVSVPVIGICKSVYPDSEVFITPTRKEAFEIAGSGVEIMAMDATLRKRPQQDDLRETVTLLKKDFPNLLLMADIAEVRDVSYAEQIGFDLIGTTLYGYTEATKNHDISENNFSHLKDILHSTKLPVIAEGKINTPEKAKTVLELGCHAVVVGGAITRPVEITTRFVNQITKKTRKDEGLDHE